MTEITKDELLKRGFQMSLSGTLYHKDIDEWGIYKNINGIWLIAVMGKHLSHLNIPITKIHEVESFYKLITKKELGN